MHKAKMDRRIKHTKAALRENMIMLMGKHPLNKISVSMLCEAADINRSTFYIHYQDVYDLADKIEQSVITALNEFMFEDSTTIPGSDFDVLKRLLIYAKDNAELFLVFMRGDNIEKFKEQIIGLVSQYTLSKVNQSQNLRQIEYMQLYAVNGSLSIMDKWLSEGIMEPVDEIARLIMNLNMDIVQSRIQ